MILHYSGGSESNGCAGNPRSMDIYLVCNANVTDDILSSIEIAYEYKYRTCKYKLTPLHTYTTYPCRNSLHEIVKETIVT